jgi:hypothetical protein
MGPARTEVLLRLARSVAGQAAEMVAPNAAYAWPLAALLMQVSATAPELPDMFLAVMQGSDGGCPLCVPLYVSWKVQGAALSTAVWRKRNGYKCASARMRGAPTSRVARAVHACAPAADAVTMHA